MRARQAASLLVFGAFASTAGGQEASSARLYVNYFQSRKLVVLDVATSKVVREIAVEDGSGSIGVAVTSDGKRLFVVDGDSSHRLRTFDPTTGKELASYPFDRRALLLGGGPVIHLTRDERWLFVDTYDYPAAASGVRVFDTQAGRFTPLGLRGRPCGAPAFASSRDGSVVAVCPGVAQELKPVQRAPGEFLPGPRVPTSISEAADVAMSADGRDLYIVEYMHDGAPWRLVRWPRGQQTPREYNLRELLQIPPDAGRRGAQAWLSVSPDGTTLLITSNQKDGYQNVGLFDIASKKITWATDTKWEASSEHFSPDGKSFTYEINADGQIDAYLADRATMRAEKIDLPPGLNYFSGNPTTFSPAGDRVLINHQSSTHPGDIWVYDLKSRRPEQLTFSAIASLETTPLPPSQIVHYKTFDGKTVSALMWVPFNIKRDGTNPGLVLPHGGPTGQMVDYWNTDVSALVSRGYVCIAPNVRGSTGYGLEFQKANYKDLGGGDLQDEVYAAKFLEATGYVDAKKTGITGGSYGGFMTLMAVGKTPDVWAAGVELFGIINWYTMLQHEDALLQEYEKSLMGDPEKDRKVYEAASPITYIHNAKAPLLVLQGDNDPRVPKEEAQQVVDLLKKDGKTVDVHYYSNEGHGFEKRENRIDSIRRTVEWFDKYLKNKQ